MYNGRLGRAWKIEEISPEAVDPVIWSRFPRSTFPEAQLGWLRFLNCPASGYHHRIRVLCALSADAFEAALVFSEAQRTFLAAYGVETAWQQVLAVHPEAKGLRCWLPLSGYHGILFLPSTRPVVLRGLLDHLASLAREEGYHFVSTPGVPGSAQALHQVLREASCLQADGAPGTRLWLTGSSLADYLASLNRGSRRNLLRARRDLLRHNGSILRRQWLGEEEARRCWELLQSTADRHAGGPPVRLPFLRHCGTPAGVDCEYLLLMWEGDIYAFAFLLFGEQVFAAKFYGSRSDRQRQRLYPWWNTAIAAIEAGYERGCRQGLFGLTMYRDKQRLGCELVPTVDYLLPLSSVFKTAVASAAAEWQAERDKSPEGRQNP